MQASVLCLRKPSNMMGAHYMPDKPQAAHHAASTPQKAICRKRSAAEAGLQADSKTVAASAAATAAPAAAGDVGSCTPGGKARKAKHAEPDNGQMPVAAAQQAGCKGMAASFPSVAAAAAGAVEGAAAAAGVLHIAAAGFEGVEQRLRFAKRTKRSATAGTAEAAAAAAAAAGQTPQAAAAAAEVGSQGVGASSPAPAAAAATGAHNSDDVRTTGQPSPVAAVLAAAAAADGTQQGLLSSLSGSAAANPDSNSAGSPAPSGAGAAAAAAAAAVEGADPGSSWGAAYSLSFATSVGDNWEPGSPSSPHRRPQQQQQEQEEHPAQHSAKKQRTGSTQHLRSGMCSSLQQPQQQQQQQQGPSLHGKPRRRKLLPHHKQDEALRAANEAQHMTEQDYIDRQARILKQRQKQRVSPDMSPGVQSRPPPGVVAAAAAAAGWEWVEGLAPAGKGGLRGAGAMLGYADSRQLQRERVQQQKQYWQDQLNRPLKQKHRRSTVQQQQKGQQQQQQKAVQLRDAPRPEHLRGPGARRAVLLAVATAPQSAAAPAPQGPTLAAATTAAAAAPAPAAATARTAATAAAPAAPAAATVEGAGPDAAKPDCPPTAVAAAHGAGSAAKHAAAVGDVAHASRVPAVHQLPAKGPLSLNAAVYAIQASPVSQGKLPGAALPVQQQQQDTLDLAEPAVQQGVRQQGQQEDVEVQSQTLPEHCNAAQCQPPQEHVQLQQQQQQPQQQQSCLHLQEPAVWQGMQQQGGVDAQLQALPDPGAAAQHQQTQDQAQLQWQQPQQQQRHHLQQQQQQQQQQVHSQAVQSSATPKRRLMTLYEAKLQSSRQHLSQVPLPDLLAIMQGVAAAARKGYVPVQPANMQALCEELRWRRLQQLSQEQQQQQQQQQGKVVGEVLPGRAGPACNCIQPDDNAVQLHAAQQQQQVQGGAAGQQRVHNWRDLPRWQQKLLKRMKPPKLACQQETGQDVRQ